MAKDIDHFSESVIQNIESRFDIEEPLSAEEREQIIQYVISTQMIEGFELDYDLAGELIDEAYARPLPLLPHHLH